MKAPGNLPCRVETQRARVIKPCWVNEVASWSDLIISEILQSWHPISPCYGNKNTGCRPYKVVGRPQQNLEYEQWERFLMSTFTIAKPELTKNLKQGPCELYIHTMFSPWTTRQQDEKELGSRENSLLLLFSLLLLHSADACAFQVCPRHWPGLWGYTEGQETDSPCAWELACPPLASEGLQLCGFFLARQDVLLV